jgi:L-seryl-tRNA(Ser) seleniumtransferase
MDSLRVLPSVDELIRAAEAIALPHAAKRTLARLLLNEKREQIRAGQTLSTEQIAATYLDRLKALLAPSLRAVINATGVILHTNLGRAPLAAFVPIARYSNLEYDLAAGRRGKRDLHTAPLLRALLDRAAVVVNNNAAAVFLVLNELAAGGEVIVSRGELIEIGDGFRIPDIMQRSGALLHEVGTTNRTCLADYAAAINERTRLILRVHPSNFHVSGFTARPDLKELCELGRQRGIPVYEDLGSGCLIDLRAYGVNEPLVEDSFSAGANLVSFSCDKLLGGPQSGIVAGDDALVARVRRNPLYRAFRIDKLLIEALENTLRILLSCRYAAIPTLEMIAESSASVRARAERVATLLHTLHPEVIASETAIGGGSTPDQVLPTFVIQLNLQPVTRVERLLRLGSPPVIARIEKDRLLLDMRTVAPSEEDTLALAVLAAAC